MKAKARAARAALPKGTTRMRDFGTRTYQTESGETRVSLLVDGVAVLDLAVSEADTLADVLNYAVEAANGGAEG